MKGQQQKPHDKKGKSKTEKTPKDTSNQMEKDILSSISCIINWRIRIFFFFTSEGWES